MRQFIKWFLTVSTVLFILTGCNDAANEVRDTGDDIRRVHFGAETGNEIDQGLTPPFPGATERNPSYFPYQGGDRQDGTFHFDTQYDIDNKGRIEKRNDVNNRHRGTNEGGPEVRDGDVNLSDRQIVERVVELTNEERRKQGLQPLEIDEQLNKAAQAKSADMAKQGYFGHQSPTYGSPFDMLRQFDISYKSAAENIAAGQETPEAVVRNWMNSEGHRANILNESLTHIGVGYEQGGSMGTYWTQLFIQK